MKDTLRHFDPETHARWLAPLGAILVVIGLAISSWWGLTLLVVGGIALLAACYSTQDGLLIFGPFIRREMTRTIRQHRVLLWRGIVVTVVGLSLGVTYFFAEGAPPASRFPAKLVPKIALGVFAFVLWNLANVYLPVLFQLVAGTVTEDREANRLDYLLVTDLRAREIILGKALGKVTTLTAYLAANLPFAILFPVLFNLDPLIVLLPLAYLFLTALSGIGFAVAGSVYSRTTKKAGANSMYCVMLYVVLTYSLSQLARYPSIWNYSFTGTFTLGYFIEAISAGNPVTVGLLIPTAFMPGGGVVTLLLTSLRAYAVVHALFFFAGLLLACKKLRHQSAELAGSAALGSSKNDRVTTRPAVWAAPVVWKEVYCAEFIPRTRTARNSARFMAFLLMILPALAIVYCGLLAPASIYDSADQLVRFMLPFVAWITFAFTGRITSALISREREKDTLVSLIATPIMPRSIIWQKYLGGLLALRGGLIWLSALTLSACVAGFYPWWAGGLLLFMFISWSIPLAAFGLFGSTTAATTQKAQMTSGLWFVTWILVPMILFIPLTVLTGFLESPFRFVSAGVSGIFGLSLAGFARDCPPGDELFWVLGGLFGSVVNVTWGWLFVRWAVKRFERACEGEEPKRQTGAT